MYYVYLLESQSHAGQHYVGFTSQKVDLRLERHNQGTTPATARYRPWRLIWAGAFLSKEIALDFERYLKSGSGRAFVSKHFLPREVGEGVSSETQ
jgi:putative endonuclease